jgi:Uma2 family endonuclease
MMSIAGLSLQHQKDADNSLPLEAGDHLDQPTFHARYMAAPEHVKAELIGGVVHMPSPVRRSHGKFHVKLLRWLDSYADLTPGTEVLDNTTSILGNDSEPRPDACLRIIDGQSKETEDDYILGPPEFIAEVASSTASYDLYSKKDDYERYGVREYLVVLIHEKRAVWYVRADERFIEMAAGADGMFRSAAMPGLWLDVAAFFRLDTAGVEAALRQGLASAEHAAFAESLKK